jgi:hypothetical protein
MQNKSIMLSIVIARYRENLDWTKQLNSPRRLIVYNKGDRDINLQENIIEINIDNVGREGHTYYKYICDNYDCLDDYTCFLQGNPFDHSPHIIETLNNLQNNENPKPEFQFLSEWIILCNLDGCVYHEGLPLRNVFTHLFGKDDSTYQFEFGAGGQFIVSRERIRARPKEFYEKIVKILNYSVNPIEGFVIERFHGLIFF